MKIEKEDIPKLDLILKQIEDDGESNSTKMAEFDSHQDLKDQEKMQRYKYLFDIVALYCGGEVFFSKDSSGMIRTAHNLNGVYRLRKTGGFKTIYLYQQRKKAWLLTLKILGVIGALSAITTIVTLFL